LHIDILLKPRQNFVDAWTQKTGSNAFCSACALLDKVGIPYVLEFAYGKVVKALIRHAQHY